MAKSTRRRRVPGSGKFYAVTGSSGTSRYLAHQRDHERHIQEQRFEEESSSLEAREMERELANCKHAHR